jgi:hypothetical protein
MGSADGMIQTGINQNTQRKTFSQCPYVKKKLHVISPGIELEP